MFLLLSTSAADKQTEQSSLTTSTRSSRLFTGSQELQECGEPQLLLLDLQPLYCRLWKRRQDKETLAHIFTVEFPAIKDGCSEETLRHSDNYVHVSPVRITHSTPGDTVSSYDNNDAIGIGGGRG